MPFQNGIQHRYKFENDFMLFTCISNIHFPFRANKLALLSLHCVLSLASLKKPLRLNNGTVQTVYGLLYHRR